ncbi:MAG: DUF924 family protein [Pseudomonadota bacterium]
MNDNYSDVIEFWFGDDLADIEKTQSLADRWFKKSNKFDDEIRLRFAHLPDRAKEGDLSHWLIVDDGLLATVITLDQFPRNLFRNSPQAFAYDALSLERAEQAMALGLSDRLHPLKASFLLMPFEHSESLTHQQLCVDAMKRIAARSPEVWQDRIQAFLRYAVAHYEIIDQFGRFPHRNEILGRTSSEEELKFLESGRGRF